MTGLPPLVMNSLKVWFHYPVEKIYCQVATVGQKGEPHIRTMLLYTLTPEGNIVLLSRTDTQKWHDLQQNSSVSVCFLNLEKGQIIGEGVAELKTKNNFADVKTYWRSLPLQFQSIYRPELSSAYSPSVKEIPPNFGMIWIRPERWEVLTIDPHHYLESLRQPFCFREGMWVAGDLLAVS